MNTRELCRYADRIGVGYGDYLVQEIGEGEAAGVGYLEGQWCFYFSERGSYSIIARYDNENDACLALAKHLRELVKSRTGVFPPAPEGEKLLKKIIQNLLLEFNYRKNKFFTTFLKK